MLIDPPNHTPRPSVWATPHTNAHLSCVVWYARTYRYMTVTDHIMGNVHTAKMQLQHLVSSKTYFSKLEDSQSLVFALHPFIFLGTGCWVMLNCRSLHLTKMGKKPGCCSASGWGTSITETEHKVIADKRAFGQRETWKNAFNSVDSYSGLACQVLNKAQTSNFI